VERAGLLKTIPGFHPAGALCATKFAPDKFVKPTAPWPQFRAGAFHYRYVNRLSAAGKRTWQHPPKIHFESSPIKLEKRLLIEEQGTRWFWWEAVAPVSMPWFYFADQKFES